MRVLHRQPHPTAWRLGRRVIAAAVCALLLITAAAAVPEIWAAIQTWQGAFAPYAQTLEGSCTDQDITLQVHSALTDGYSARVYYTLTDAQNRLSIHTTVQGRLAGTSAMGSGTTRTQVLSCGEDGVLLAMTKAVGIDFSQEAALQLGEITPAVYQADEKFFLSLAEEPLNTAENADGQQAALPGQNRQTSGENRDFYLSSVGMDRQGRFQVLVTFRAGFGGDLLAVPCDAQDNQLGTSLDRVETGAGTCSIRTGVNPEEVAYIRVYGSYQSTAEPIHGAWTLPLDLQPVERTNIQVNRTIGPFPVEQIQISALGVTVLYRPAADGTLFYGDNDVTLTKQDGTSVALTLEMSGQAVEPGARYSVWSCSDPAVLEEIAAVTVLGESFHLR